MNVIVVGGGIAGLTAALRADALGHRVTLLVKDILGDGCTACAQGGIAGAYGPGDSPALHALDTMQAGNGHGDVWAITALVEGASAAIDALLRAGVAFDLDAAGGIARGLEAAHSLPRIAHAGGDATGAAISAALVARVRASRVQVHECAFAADLVVEGGRVQGTRMLDGTTHEADAVVLATGGAGQLYTHTTNPLGTTGDGIAMALRAGAAVADLEFVQFHPTVLADGSPFLVSEAVRGAGAVLRDAAGRRFMLAEHPDAELAPRDVVARAVARVGAVALDATGVRDLAARFPTIDAELRSRGIDWTQHPVPVMPAAHYLMGGVATDIDGRTSLPGLCAVGETARTGVHGANRLASNSLLEGAVFGARAADSLTHPSLPYEFLSLENRFSDTNSYRSEKRVGGPFTRAALQQLMWDAVGLTRTDAGLAGAVAQLNAWADASPREDLAEPRVRTTASQEDANLLTVARATVSAALARTDSLGAHFRLSSALIGAA